MLSLTDLQTPDERTLRFLPMGLGTAHKLYSDSAAEFQQRAVDVQLADVVPEGVRGSYDRVRLLHAYGVLSYELFTAAHDLTRLILEQALRTRFVEYYDGAIPFVAKDGTPTPLVATKFDVVYDALNGGSHRKAQRLVIGDGSAAMYFRGSLQHLLAWARTHRLLAGQRNRMLEGVFVRMRNDVAHPTQDHLVLPVNSSTAIRDLGEIINRLWGVRTPGGRLYPKPIHLKVLAIGRNAKHTSFRWVQADDLDAANDEEMTEYVLVRASEDEREIWRFETRRDTMHFPSEYLWGPGSRDDALAWLRRARPQTDDVDHHDRLFLIHETDGGVSGPLRPHFVAALDTDDGAGTWHLVMADHPGDALHHVRQLVHGGEECVESGPCTRCAAETMTIGTRDEVRAAYEDAVGVIQPKLVPELRVDEPLTTPAA